MGVLDIEPLELAENEVPQGVGSSTRVIRSISLSEVDPKVGAEEGLEATTRLVHEQLLLAVLSKESLEVELGQRDVRVDGPSASRIQDSRAPAELPHPNKGHSTIVFISIEVDRGVVRLLADDHGLVDTKPRSVMLNYDVHRVDDRRPVLGELESAGHKASLDFLLVALLEVGSVLECSHMWGQRVDQRP